MYPPGPSEQTREHKKKILHSRNELRDLPITISYTRTLKPASSPPYLFCSASPAPTPATRPTTRQISSSPTHIPPPTRFHTYHAQVSLCLHTSRQQFDRRPLRLKRNNPPNPTDNPLRGTTISNYNAATGGTTQATIVDTCQGRRDEDGHMSPNVFKAVAPNGMGDGRTVADQGGSAVGGKE